MAQHYMTWPTASTAVCGADMTGRRNSRLDTDTAATDCYRCTAWLAEQAEMERRQDQGAWDSQDA